MDRGNDKNGITARKTMNNEKKEQAWRLWWRGPSEKDWTDESRPVGEQTKAAFFAGYEAAKAAECTWGKYWADGDVYISACEPDRDFLMDADAQFPTYCGNCGGKISPTWKGE